MCVYVPAPPSGSVNARPGTFKGTLTCRGEEVTKGLVTELSQYCVEDFKSLRRRYHVLGSVVLKSVKCCVSPNDLLFDHVELRPVKREYM